MLELEESLKYIAYKRYDKSKEINRLILLICFTKNVANYF